MPDTIDNNDVKALPPPRGRNRVSRKAVAAGAVVAVLLAGTALGTGGSRRALAQFWQPRSVLLLQPAPINQMRDYTTIAIKGDVAEIFGNKFIVQDGSGRALVDTGPRGDDRKMVEKGESLTIQGRFDRGIVRAEVIVHADGRNDAFGPPGPKGGPKEGPKGPKGVKGPRDDHDGPRADRDGPPPPPPAE